MKVFAALLVVASVALAEPIPEIYKKLPVYAPLVPKTLTYSKELKGFVGLPSRFTVYRSFLENPTYLIARSAPADHFDIYFLEKGLNSYSKNPSTKAVFDVLRSPADHVAVVYPASAFPVERFPNLINSEFVIPEYKINFASLLSETPIVALIPKEEFNAISSEDLYDIVADIELQKDGIRVAREFQPAIPEIKLKAIPSATVLAAPAPFYYVYAPSAIPTLAQQVSAQPPYNIPSNVGPAPPPAYTPAANPPPK